MLIHFDNIKHFPCAGMRETWSANLEQLCSNWVCNWLLDRSGTLARSLPVQHRNLRTSLRHLSKASSGLRQLPLGFSPGVFLRISRNLWDWNACAWPHASSAGLSEAAARLCPEKKKKATKFLKQKKSAIPKNKSCLVEGILSGILTVSHLSGPHVAGWTIWRYDDMICNDMQVKNGVFCSDLLDPVCILLGFLDAVVAWVQNHSNTTQHSKVSMNPHQLSQPPHRGFQSPSICQALPGSYRQIRYHHNWKKRKTENQQSR